VAPAHHPPYAPVSITSKSCVSTAVFASIAEAEQYFSTDNAIARSTLEQRQPNYACSELKVPVRRKVPNVGSGFIKFFFEVDFAKR
jgi:hypothetical protein